MSISKTAFALIIAQAQLLLPRINFFFNSQNNEKGVQVLESHGSNKLKASRKYIKICNPESKLRQVSAFQN